MKNENTFKKSVFLEVGFNCLDLLEINAEMNLLDVQKKYGNINKNMILAKKLSRYE
jgi:hypothetical protein